MINNLVNLTIAIWFATRFKIFCLWLRVEKNGGAVETKPEWVRRDMEKELFPHYQIKKRSKDGWRYDVRFEQSDHCSYEKQAHALIDDMIEFVDPYWCFIECSILDESTDEPVEIANC